MIKYGLICDKEHEFDGWFASGAGFERQRDGGLLSCPRCGSVKVDRAIMAPTVPKKANRRDDGPRLRQMMQKLTAHVEENFDYVGRDFAEEARKIYYGESEERDIYGEATPDEAHELCEEGVPVAPLPGPAQHDKN